MSKYPKILKIRVEHRTDEQSDLSWLGEYSQQPGNHAIDRQARGDCGQREYRYFNPGMTAEETGNPDSEEQDYQRMEAYNRGDWCMLGIIAKAEIQLAENGPIQVIHSGGLWGVESDSGNYLTEVAIEELRGLSEELAAIGCGKRAIAYAVNQWRENGKIDY